MSAGIGNPFKRQHFHIETKELRMGLKIGSDASHMWLSSQMGCQTIQAGACFSWGLLVRQLKQRWANGKRWDCLWQFVQSGWLLNRKWQSKIRKNMKLQNSLNTMKAQLLHVITDQMWVVKLVKDLEKIQMEVPSPHYFFLSTYSGQGEPQLHLAGLQCSQKSNEDEFSKLQKRAS